MTDPPTALRDPGLTGGDKAKEEMQNEKSGINGGEGKSGETIVGRLEAQGE